MSAEQPRTDEFGDIVDLVADFFASKGMIASERSMRREYALLMSSALGRRETEISSPCVLERMKQEVLARNAYTSALEHRLDICVPRDVTTVPVPDVTPNMMSFCTSEEWAPPTTTRRPSSPAPVNDDAGVIHLPRRKHVRVDEDEADDLRDRHGTRTPQQRAVFHECLELPDDHGETIEEMSLPMMIVPHVNGLETDAELHVDVGDLLAARYRAVASLGRGAFSKVYQCVDLKYERMVAVKVVLKDELDAGLGEVRALALINRHDPNAEQPLSHALDYFYYKEHLVIVTELLRESLRNLVADLPRTRERLAYFTPTVLASLGSQILDALVFIHGLGIAHTDVKPDNVCVCAGVWPNVRFKLIDFGSAVFRYDTHNSYVQSRWYRAPEVILGLQWDTKIDVWSFGCVLAEALLGAPIFKASAVEPVVAAQVAAVGPMPAHMTTGREAQRVFMDNGGVYHVDPPSMPPGVYLIQQPRAGSSLALLLGRATQDAGLIELLTSLLTLDPERRPTALVARQHMWLRAAPAPVHVKPFAPFSTSVLGATHGEASPSWAIENE